MHSPVDMFYVTHKMTMHAGIAIFITYYQLIK